MEVFHSGYAQKWVNMALKCLRIIDNLFLLETISPMEGCLHAIIDGVVLRYLWERGVEGLPHKVDEQARHKKLGFDNVKPWSKLNYSEYSYPFGSALGTKEVNICKFRQKRKKFVTYLQSCV